MKHIGGFTMKKIAYVADSSIGITLQEQKSYPDLFIAPLSIIHNGKEYIDQIDLSEDDVNAILRKNNLVQTSQPNVGTCINLFNEIIAKGYDEILVFSLSSFLSGTFNSFSAAKDDLNLPNIHVIDSLSIAGAVQEGVLTAQRLNEQGKSIDEIIAVIKDYYKDTISYVIPETLNQLKASGRISPAASAVASMLKMKVLLRLENGGETIEKFATARTDKKLLDTMNKDLESFGFDPKIHKIYLLHSDGLEPLNVIKESLLAHFGDIETSVGLLPAAVSGHAGIGTVAVQLVRKASTY